MPPAKIVAPLEAGHETPVADGPAAEVEVEEVEVEDAEVGGADVVVEEVVVVATGAEEGIGTLAILAPQTPPLELGVPSADLR